MKDPEQQISITLTAREGREVATSLCISAARAWHADLHDAFAVATDLGARIAAESDPEGWAATEGDA